MERDLLDTAKLLGLDVVLMTVVGLFLLRAVELAVHRRLDRVREQPLPAPAQRSIYPASRTAAALVAGSPTLPPQQLLPMPEWLNRLLQAKGPPPARLPMAWHPDAGLGRRDAAPDHPAAHERGRVRSARTVELQD